MSKVRINDLARELEVKSRVILDILPEVGVTEKKTHSSSVEEDEAVRVRAALGRGGKAASKRGETAAERAEAKDRFVQHFPAWRCIAGHSAAERTTRDRRDRIVA